VSRFSIDSRVVGAAAALAVMFTLGYALLISPAFEPHWDDQVAYLRLAHGLIERGEYTRAAVGAPFVPEPLWPPGYPLFLAPLCVVGCSKWLIAIVQALLYGGLVVLVFDLARQIVSARAARIAAVLVALYFPIAYWAAIAYSDFLATFQMVAALWTFLRARRLGSVGWAMAAGALFGWLALTRLAYVAFPAALLLVVLVADGRRVITRQRLRPLVALAAAFLLVVAPLFLYSQRYLHQPFVSGGGATLWIGAVQFADGSRLDDFEAAEVTAVNAEVASFDRITDRAEQADAWVPLNASLGSHGLRFIQHDVAGYLSRAPFRAILLWAGDVPVPVDAERSLDPAIRFALITIELALIFVALLGAVVLARRRDDAALLPLAVMLYLTVLLVPLGTVPRYSLAAKPLVLIAVVALFDRWQLTRMRDSQRRSLP
jgi:4-amino-4-deoxy-L-arabinose transferase-like glycosyltransferase